MRLKLWLPVLAMLLLAACALPSGENVILPTPEQHYNFYRNGAVAACMQNAREEMKRLNVPLTTLNLTNAYALCVERAEGLLRSHGIDAPLPVPVPQVAPAANGDGKL